MKHCLLAAVMLAYSLSVSAQPSEPLAPDTATTIAQRVVVNERLGEHFLDAAWRNPAVKQWQHGYSFSTVEAQFSHWQSPTDVQRGDKEQIWTFDAATYMKHRTSTLWGRAYYHNGHTDDIRWNETSDIDIVRPYLLADSVGGKRMKLERYSFMGGYADHNERFSWGGSIGYTAGLYYRNVDPRPRNVTADLDITAGAAIQVAKRYDLALALLFKKYKQTNNVAFYSELGNEKLFHLTGMTTDYARFAGTGYNTYYKGYRRAASLNLHPHDNRGLSASVEVSRFTLDNVLTSFNKLPLAGIGHNELNAEAAWLSRKWKARAHLDASRRVGTENIFGDPAASVYRKIGSLDMYYENVFNIGAGALWESKVNDRFNLGFDMACDYHHINTLYVEPYCHRLLEDFSALLRGKATYRTGGVVLSLTAWVERVTPTCRLTLNGTAAELAGLQRAVEDNFDYLSDDRTAFGAETAVFVTLTPKYALKFSVNYRHNRFSHHHESERQVLATAGVCF